MKQHSKLVQRFVGADGQRAIAEELAKQEIITGRSNAMIELARRGRIFGLRKGQTLIKQGEASNDIFFIFCGKLTIKRNNRRIIERGPRENVGEMAMIDRSHARSATVVAAEDSVILRVAERDFTAVAVQFPDLWRNLAQQCAKRLRQRLDDVRPKNDIPVVFIGSSSESLPIAKAVKHALDPVAKVTIWTEGVFGPDQFTLESLEQQTKGVDFAVMVFAEDDRVFCRGKASATPRDNVVFELGLFMGALGHKRTFLIKPSQKNLKIPSDLRGINYIEYVPGSRNGIARAIKAAGLVEIIQREGAF